MDSPIEQEIKQMQETLLFKAPRLRPRVLPRGYDDEMLLNLGLNPKQKEQLNSFVKQIQINTKNCSLCLQTFDDNLKFDKLKLVLDVSINIEKKCLKLESALFLCEMCETLFNLEKFLHVSCIENANIDGLVQHFFKVNKIEIKSNIERMQYLQECYSLAFALKVLISNIPRLKVVRKNEEPLDEKTSFEILYKELFSSSPTVSNSHNDKNESHQQQ